MGSLAVRVVLRWGFLWSVMAAVSSAGHAGEVYRCGTTYQDHPCSPRSTQAPMEVASAPSEQDRAQAAKRVEQEARLAQQLTRERERREAEQRAQAQKQPVALSSPHASTLEDNDYTRCTGTKEQRKRWSERKREYCATRYPEDPSTHKRRWRYRD